MNEHLNIDDIMIIEKCTHDYFQVLHFNNLERTKITIISLLQILQYKMPSKKQDVH